MPENMLVENPTWTPGIYQIETDDPVIGGPDGLTNRPSRELANRTLWLKGAVEGQSDALAAHEAGNNHPVATTADKGMVVLATVAEAVAGVLANKVITPQGLAAAVDAMVDAAVAALVASSPATLDTLDELAAALGDDPNFATTITNALADKAPLASPSFLRALGRGTNLDWNTAIPTNDRFGGAWWFDGGGVNPNGPEGANSIGALYQFNALWISGTPNGALQLVYCS